ncbi:hypothetical protein PybrP1_002734 [[Pythium] brassicae (nom. inval.)]|nr:hypothetical protein PybrP1_002734 [[Pythium] brassicae (nom. inval.)]
MVTQSASAANATFDLVERVSYISSATKGGADGDYKGLL